MLNCFSSSTDCIFNTYLLFLLLLYYIFILNIDKQWNIFIYLFFFLLLEKSSGESLNGSLKMNNSAVEFGLFLCLFFLQ